MKFSKVPNDPDTGLFHRRASQNVLIEIGVYRVIYGFRVRAGFVGEYDVRWDWCCGDNWDFVQTLYSLGLSILESRPEDRKCFEDVPSVSTRKPAFNDPEFMLAVCEKAHDVRRVELDREAIA